MALCDMGFEHSEPAVVEPEPVVVDPGPNQNDVAIAEVEAAASIERAKINAETEIAWQEGRVSELEGQVRGMREILDRIVPPEPEPEPEVVVVPDSSPAVEEATDGPPEIEPPKKEKAGGGMWANYK